MDKSNATQSSIEWNAVKDLTRAQKLELAKILHKKAEAISACAKCVVKFPCFDCQVIGQHAGLN